MSELNLRLCPGCMQELQEGQSICPSCGWDLSMRRNPEEALPEGTVLFRKYLIGKMIGRGGFGITYLGYDLDLEIKVAIKEYYPTGYCTRASRSYNVMTVTSDGEPGFFSKGCEVFLDEARTLAKFNSPSVVHVRDFFREHETAYIVMDFVEGVTLKDEIKRYGRLPLDRVLSLMEPLIRQLGKLHEKNIIHRDIKPENLMIVKDGDEERVVLLDFGAARYFASDRTKTMTGVVTHGFAPLEQYSQRSRQGPYSDVHALCATIYNALTGATPPPSTARSADDVPIDSFSSFGLEIPDHVEAAIMHGLALRRENRTQSMGQLLSELSASPSTPVQPQDTQVSGGQEPEQAVPPEPEQDHKGTEGKQNNNSPVNKTEEKTGTISENPISSGQKAKSNTSSLLRNKKIFLISGSVLAIGLILFLVLHRSPGPLKSSQTDQVSVSTETVLASETGNKAEETKQSESEPKKMTDVATISDSTAPDNVSMSTIPPVAEAEEPSSPPVYTITWLDADGNTIDSQEAAAGTLPVYEALTKEADEQYTYTFTGWSPEISPVSGNIAYQATFDKALRKYTITWKGADGGIIGSSSAEYGSTPSHAAATKQADQLYEYSFVGWSPEIVPVTSDATYQAKFSRSTRKYSITWKDSDGKVYDVDSVPYGATPAHSDPVKEADDQYIYTFTGWKPEIKKVTGDATYKATFTTAPISTSKPSWVCSTCNQENPDGDSYCTRCATPRDASEQSADASHSHSDIEGTWICINCRTENSLNDIFCTNCAQTKHCLECGHSVPKDDKFCSNCATEIGKWKCSQCGQLSGTNAVFCENCGTERHKPGEQQ